MLVLVLGSFLVVAYRLLSERLKSGKGLPPYSVYSDRSDGLGEAAHVVRRLGLTPAPLTRMVSPALQRGLLVLAGPGRDEMSDADARALLAWVETGNTLLFASSEHTPLHEALNLTVWRPPGEEDDPEEPPLSPAASG